MNLIQNGSKSNTIPLHFQRVIHLDAYPELFQFKMFDPAGVGAMLKNGIICSKETLFG